MFMECPNNGCKWKGDEEECIKIYNHFYEYDEPFCPKCRSRVYLYHVKCEDCGTTYARFIFDVVLTNEQWKMIHPESKEGILCVNCILERASKLKEFTVARLIFE